MTLPLTAKQEQLWRYIKSCDRSPTYTEMARALYGHVHAKGRINKMVCALKDRGFVNYVPNRARSIVALDPVSLITTAELTAELGRRGFGVVMLPLHGRIE